DLRDIIKLEVNPRTLVGAMQESIETQGIEIPEKYFTSFIRDEAKVVKGKTKKIIEKDEHSKTPIWFDKLTEKEKEEELRKRDIQLYHATKQLKLVEEDIEFHET